MTSSPYLARLDKLIAEGGDRIQIDCWRGERASYFARQGRWEEATSELSSLHSRYDAAPNVHVSIWLNLAEGHLSFFQDMGALATDKLRRAHALSTAAGLGPLQARAAGWLANIEFNAHRFDRMAQYMSEALGLARPEDHGVLARACLVGAQALHLANRWDLAMPWYAATHRHAVDEGDDAMISALMYNMAAIRAANLRLVELAHVQSTERWHLVHLGATSAETFDALIGSHSLDTFTPLVRAQLMSNQGRWIEALDIYNRYAGPSTTQGLTRLQSWFQADMAWCQLRLGDRSAAQTTAESAASRIDKDAHVDDLAATHSRLARVFAELNMDGAAEHAALADQRWESFRVLQARITELLAPMKPL